MARLHGAVRPGDWTPAEMEMLGGLAGRMSAREIAQRVGHTRFATLKKMEQLGIKGCAPGRVCGWTEAQKAALRAARPGISARQFAREQGLTRESVRYWARRFGVTLGRAPRFHGWSCEDEARLRELASTHSTKQAAAALGRSQNAIQDRAHRLGLRMRRPSRAGEKRGPYKKRGTRAQGSEGAAARVYVKRPWTLEEDLRLRSLSVASVEQVARDLGRTPKAVRNRAAVRGVHIPRAAAGCVIQRARKAPAVRLVVAVPKVRAVVMARPVVEMTPAVRLLRRSGDLARSVEYCPQCGAPVSDWEGHARRLGHQRPAA